MALGPRENWLVFVDTNILLDFYRLGGESAERSLAALERHSASLILTNQVWMEFLKNRQSVIVESIGKLVKPPDLSVPPILGNYQPAKTMAQRNKAVSESHRKVTEKIEAILRNPSVNDTVYRALKRLFNQSTRLNLGLTHQSRFEIRRLARKRFVLGYPPRKGSDTSMGDAINWEWQISCASAVAGSHLLIVSRDTDYGVRYRGDAILNDWLRQEFNERVGRRRKIELTNKLTVALKRLDEAVTPEDEAEEAKVIATSDAGMELLPSRGFQALGRGGGLVRHARYSCAVCGAHDTWSGSRCMTCGFVDAD